MRNNKQSFLRMLNLRNFCIAAILAIFLVLAGNRTAFSANVSANFTVTDVHFYSNDAKTNEITTTNGIGANSGGMLASISWKYNSETPIADGDTASFGFGSKITNTGYGVPDSGWTQILDENGVALGEWSLENRVITIRFSGASVGHYMLEGTINTARNITLNGMRSTDIIVDFYVAGNKYSFLKTANASFGNLIDGATFGATPTNQYITWEYMTPGVTVNELYKGNGQVALSEKATFSNLIFEKQLNDNTASTSFTIFARAPVPKNLTDGTAGGGGTGTWYNVTGLFKRRDSSEGQSYEDYRASLDELEYGIYKDESGKRTAVVRLGKQPSDKIKYSDLTSQIVYGSLPEATTTMQVLKDNNAGGGAAQFVVDLKETFVTTVSGGTRVPAFSDYSYDDTGSQIDINKTVTIPVGSASAVIIGEARLRLVDENTGKPLPGRSFILQVQDSEEWKDVPGTERATDADGRIQVLGLTPGKNYRWQQLDFADHYNADSLKVRLDQPTRRGVPANNPDFIMPTNAGISFTATNALQTYTVTYQLGDGSNDEDIVFTQYYGDTTKQPDMTTINVNEGYTFEGWSREIAPTVTENVTYVAKWSAVVSARRGTDPETPAVTNPDSNVEPPLTYDALSRYIAILVCSIALSFYFAPSTLRAYRVHKYRK